MSIRKVALVVTGLDRRTADRLLEQFPDDVAQQVRDAAMALDEIDPAEQREAIQLFLNGADDRGVGRSLNTAAQRGDGQSGIDGSAQLDSQDMLVTKQLSELTSKRRADVASVSAGSHPMELASERLIAECLCNELPQAIAVALSQLPTRRASEVVSHLPAQLQADVLERMVTLDPASAIELASVQEEFKSWLHEQVERALHRSELALRLATILGATNSGTRERILHNVSNSDAGLAKELHHQLTSVASV